MCKRTQENSKIRARSLVSFQYECQVTFFHIKTLQINTSRFIERQTLEEIFSPSVHNGHNKCVKELLYSAVHCIRCWETQSQPESDACWHGRGRPRIKYLVFILSFNAERPKPIGSHLLSAQLPQYPWRMDSYCHCHGSLQPKE